MACIIPAALEAFTFVFPLICLICQLRLIPALPAGDSLSTYDTRRLSLVRKKTFMPKSPPIPELKFSHSDLNMAKLQRSTGVVNPGSSLKVLIPSITAFGSGKLCASNVGGMLLYHR